MNRGRAAARIWGERYLERSRPDDEDEIHAHDEAFLACLEAGVLELRSAVGSWMVAAKSVTFVPAGFPHVVRGVSREVAGWMLHLPEAYARALGEEPRVVEMSELFVALSERIVEWGRPKRAPTPVESRVLHVVLDELASAREPALFRVPLPRQVGLVRVTDAILADPSDRRGLDALAKLAGKSRRTFTRHFAADTGLTFAVWRQRVRIRAAIRMLARGASVTATGIDLGFASTSAFIAMFRKHTGASPAIYMRRLSHEGVRREIDEGWEAKPHASRRAGRDSLP